jgi:hypothetical protein
LARLLFGVGPNSAEGERGRGFSHVAGAVIGPFPTATLLRIWLTDFHAPVYTFYSDGNHALVSGTNLRRCGQRGLEPAVTDHDRERAEDTVQELERLGIFPLQEPR